MSYRKALASLLVIVLLLSSCCAFAAPEYLNTDGSYPLVNEGTDITLRITQRFFAGDTGEVEDLWYPVYAKNVLNINFDIEQIPTDAFAERLQLMFAAGDLPDIIQDGWLSTSQLLQYGQIEQQLLNFANYLDYMPDFADAIHADAELLQAASTPDKGIYALPIRGSTVDNYSSRTFINQKWIDALGIETPKTLDEFIDMLRLFKSEDPGNVGAENVIPLGGGYSINDSPITWLLYAMGFMGHRVTSIALRNGEVTIPGGDPLYKEFLTILKTLYDEGLVSPDFFTTDITQANAQYAEGVAGVIIEAPFLYTTDYMDYVAYTPLSSEWSETAKYMAPSVYRTGNFAVSSSTQYPELCALFGNLNYTPEGYVLATYGSPKDSDISFGWAGYYMNDNNEMVYIDVENGKRTSNWLVQMGDICSIFPSRYGLEPSNTNPSLKRIHEAADFALSRCVQILQ